MTERIVAAFRKLSGLADNTADIAKSTPSTHSGHDGIHATKFMELFGNLAQSSLRFDAGEFDDFAPFLGFFGDEFCEIVGQSGRAPFVPYLHVGSDRLVYL